MFRIQLVKDNGVTGRLEVTISYNYAQKKSPLEEGILIHSKSKGQGFGYENWKAFEERLKAAVAKAPSSSTE